MNRRSIEINGAELTYLEAGCEKLASYLPDVQQVILPDTSHALCLESPGPFSEAALQFLHSH
jgi:pimeloyl-ACP methyl ester carboxylesterase